MALFFLVPSDQLAALVATAEALQEAVDAGRGWPPDLWTLYSGSPSEAPEAVLPN